MANTNKRIERIGGDSHSQYLHTEDGEYYTTINGSNYEDTIKKAEEFAKFHNNNINLTPIKDKTMTHEEAINTWDNGNIEEFKNWLKKCTKLQLLNAIEYSETTGTPRHITINRIRLYLEQMTAK